MAKFPTGFILFFSVTIACLLGLISFISCIIAETKKLKKEDVKLDTKLCYLPESRTLGYGVAALTCLIVAQIIGNSVICCNLWRRKNAITYKAKKPNVATGFLVLSWVSFGAAVIIISAATSISRKQEYGKGWLEEECYMVKDGVYFGSGFLVLLSTAATLASALSTITKPTTSTTNSIL